MSTNPTKKEIQDFGEKIGGARKDLYREGGISLSSLDYMNEAEMRTMVRRDTVWPLPNAVKAVEGGMPPFVVYWAREVRKTAYASPRVIDGKTIREMCELYITNLREFRCEVEKVQTEQAIETFYAKMFDGKRGERLVDKLSYVIYLSDLRTTQTNLWKYRIRCERSGFPNTKRKSGKRKPRFIPPQLEHIEREGEDYRHGLNIDAGIWQKEFNFRGVEFGNWLSQKDRQFSMNYAYDALKDLAYALDIPDEDIAFGGKLALGFGSRGHSSTSAHYEPMREVINLTKMRGAGCTAHEWFIALDDRLAKWCGIDDGSFASVAYDNHSDVLPQAFVKLAASMKKDANGNLTDYYRGSRTFARYFAKNGHSQWNDTTDMLARAFACYIKDVLGYKSDYLIAHADCYELEYENQHLCAIPQGEERELYNELFDQLFYELKEMGLLHQRPYKATTPAIVQTPVVFKTANAASPIYKVVESSGGQFRLVL